MIGGISLIIRSIEKQFCAKHLHISWTEDVVEPSVRHASPLQVHGIAADLGIARVAFANSPKNIFQALIREMDRRFLLGEITDQPVRTRPGLSTRCWKIRQSPFQAGLIAMGPQQAAMIGVYSQYPMYRLAFAK